MTSYNLSGIEEDLLYNLGIMEDSGELCNSDFTEIRCFCHILTQEVFLQFISLKEKGFIDFKETRNNIKKVRLTNSGRSAVSEIKASWKL